MLAHPALSPLLQHPRLDAAALQPSTQPCFDSGHTFSALLNNLYDGGAGCRWLALPKEGAGVFHMFVGVSRLASASVCPCPHQLLELPAASAPLDT